MNLTATKVSARLDANTLDLPVQIDPGILLYARAYSFTELFDLSRSGTTFIDQEVAMHLGYFCRTNCEAAHAGCIDELPGFFTFGVLEC